MNCPLCDELVLPTDDSHPVSGMPAHRECLLRNVMGGIGHLENHNYWCNEMHDPDGGRTYRQSGLEVDQWIVDHWGATPP